MKVTCLDMLPKEDTKLGEVTDVKTGGKSVHRQTAYLISPVQHCEVSLGKVATSQVISLLGIKYLVQYSVK